MEDFRGYLRWFVGSVVLLAIALTGFIVLMDPYRVFGTPTIEGVNEVKPYPDQFQSEIKLLMARRGKADILILGNSRAEIGFDPEHEAFAHARVFNLSVPGSGIETAYAQLEEHSRRSGPPKRVLIGLDLIDFLVAPEAMEKWVQPSPLSGLRDLQWKAEATFSLGALWEAFHMLAMQDDPYASRLSEHGLNPLSDYPKLAARSGYFPLFQQRAQESAKLYVRLPKALRNGHGSSPAIDALRGILDLVQQHGIAADLIIYPYHAQLLLLMEQSGMKEPFREWKALLTQELERGRVNRIGNVRLWDFSGFAGARCEAIPARGDRSTVTSWYWEAGHFKRELGDVILREVMQGERQADVLNGFPLHTNDLVENEARIATERAACLASQPALEPGIEALVQAGGGR